MLIAIDCFSTECAKEDMFKVQGYGEKEYKNRRGISTVAFSSNKIIVPMNFISEEDTYYVKYNKKHRIYVHILDTETKIIKCYSLYEITQMIYNNIEILNIQRQTSTYWIDLSRINIQLNYIANTKWSIFIEYILSNVDLYKFMVKSSLIPKCFYIVKLERVNDNTNFVFDFDVVKKDFDKLKNSLDYLYNSIYTLAFYTKRGDFVGRFNVDYITMILLYYNAGRIGYIYSRSNGRAVSEVLYQNHAIGGTEKGNKFFYYAIQFKDVIDKNIPELDRFNLELYDIKFNYGIPHKIICDKRPCLNLNIKTLVESFNE